MRSLIAICVSVFFFFPVFALHAQEVHQELQEIITADVTQIISEEVRDIEGTGATAFVQEVEATLTSGAEKGRSVVFENELVKLKEGDTVYLNHVVTIQGDEYFLFKDFKRQTQLLVLGLLFAALLIYFARMHGFRALFSLGLSIAAIVFVLVPSILAGFNPVLLSAGISGVILACVLFLTHGFNPRSVIAFLGTFSAVLVTCLIAWVSVSSMRLTGFGSDAAIYLNFSTNGTLDFAGLLLGSIIIGILGVLDDVSITQASVVQELKRANHAFSARELYSRAINVGKDHIGSLVNTLALAYIGVSLPLVLLFATADASLSLTLNQEVVAAELVRIMVGSIGLVLAIPLTTLIAAWWYGTHEVKESEENNGHIHHHH